MIKGKKKVNISREYIFSKIHSYDVFKRYMPWAFKLNVVCRNPFTSKDNNPSFIIGNKFGEITFKAFNSDNRGDCISFVMQMFSLNYKQALEKIAKDFGIEDGKDNHVSIISQYSIPKIVKVPTKIQAKVTSNFRAEELKYLERFFLTPEDFNFCNDTKLWSVKEWYLNKILQPVDSVCFAYQLKNKRGNWLKVYKPYAQKKEKWKSSIPFLEMHGVGNIGSNGGDTGIIVKSMKDGAFLNKYVLRGGIEVVQAEDYTAISDENAKRLLSSCKNLYISFDSDSKGVESCIKITQKLGCKYINPPKQLYNEHGITDWCEMAEYYGSPQPVIDFFKFKKVI